MAKAKTSVVATQSMNPGIWMVMTFFIVFVINMVVIHFANGMYPMNVVLGTMSIPPLWAVILNSAVIALTTTFAMPFINEAEKYIGRLWSPPELMGIYLVINFVTLWLLGRVAEIFGLGVSSWLVVLALSVVLDIVQGAVMMIIEKMRTSR
jgi:hypothetical protein